ncbi:Lactate utilization protein A [bacterium HR17]|uniref:Glycolate oxidase iron-sulfur subunit n=1 Tax=Candidatus Fervidibacter japonicus TaxID=2035412 RepID=A0A2H5XCR2_9BACT|nr:Lactate utilization protein A [bacterium HR17]
MTEANKGAAPRTDDTGVRQRPALVLDDATFELLMDCVHCGFCLPTCPTFALTGDETDSPRGRLYYLRLLAEGRIDADETVLVHLDRCLDCRACETACPSGVQYGLLIELARAQLARQGKGPLRRSGLNAWLIRHIFPYPSRIAALLAPLRAAQAMGVIKWLDKIPKLGRMAQMVPPLPAPQQLPAIVPAKGVRQLRVGLLTGCIASVVFSPTNRAAAEVLAAAGCEVVVPPQQPCCGSLLAHTGQPEAARHFARQLIATFERYEPLDAIVVTAAGCGTTMKAYGHLLHDDPEFAERAHRFAVKVRDFSELLDGLAFQMPLKPLRWRVTYHDPCHMAHGQKIREQPRRLLQRVPEVELVELPEADWCCGSAGVYNLLQPEFADALLERKMTNIRATGAEVVVTANPGCLMQLWYGAQRYKVPVRVMHLADFLRLALV